MIGMCFKKFTGLFACSRCVCVRRMLVFTSASAVWDAHNAGARSIPRQSGALSRGLVIGWQVRMTWVWLEDRESKA
jgi:hypothetical protein